MDLPTFEIIVGTYEEYLLGYSLTVQDECVKMIQSFATHDHTSSVRCVTSYGKYLASGGADDRIIIYDMKNRREHCMLSTHSATITCLKFTIDNSHIISGCNDGILAIVRVGNWQLEKLWKKPHKGTAILDIAVHSSGKLALTLGANHTLKTWNLIKGREAYAVNLATKSKDFKSLDSIKWSPDGENFILSGGLNVEYWNITIGGIVKTYNFKSRVTSTCWLNKTYLAIGLEDGKITILNMKTEEQNIYPAHSMRVKCLESSDYWLVSASSDGHIKVWNFRKNKLTEIADTSTGCRCTCLTLVSGFNLKTEKTKNEEEIVKNTKLENDKKKRITGKQQKGFRVIVEEENDNETVKEKGIKRKKLNKDKAKKKNKKIANE